MGPMTLDGICAEQLIAEVTEVQVKGPKLGPSDFQREVGRASRSLAHPALAAFFGAVSAISAILASIARVTAGACRSGEYVERD
jgi:hypothetical protein